MCSKVLIVHALAVAIHRYAILHHLSNDVEAMIWCSTVAHYHRNFGRLREDVRHDRKSPKYLRQPWRREEVKVCPARIKKRHVRRERSVAHYIVGTALPLLIR